MSKIDELMNRYHDEIKKLITDSYNEGFDEALGIKLPSQRKFDEDHKRVLGYGEEDNWLILSHNLYTEDEARDLFKKYMVENGWYDKTDTEELNARTESLSPGWIGYKRGEDNEPSYFIGKDIPTYWQAWVVDSES